MLTIQQIADIAARHDTAIADATLSACVMRALRTGERLRPRHRARRRRRGERPDDDVDWARMVRTNADIPALFR